MNSVETQPTAFSTTMTLTLTINNNQVIQGDAQQIAEFLQITERMGTISNTITTPVTNTQTETVSETEPEELEEFDVFISSILKDYFKESYVERIVSKLSEISEKIINHEFIDFRSARGLYWNFAYTCLLYTSPSPRDATLSRMPSSA